MIKNSEPTLRVVCFHNNEDDMYVMQCLEHDIAAEGKTVDEAKDAFIDAFIGHYLLCCQLGREPLASAPRGPEDAWRKWAASAHQPKEILEIPAFTIRKRADYKGAEPQPHQLELALVH